MPDFLRESTADALAAGAPAPYAPPPDGSPAAAHAAAPLVEFLASVRRHRRLILAVAVPAALCTAAFCLLRTREYASASSFVPQSKGQNSTLSALAAQYGVNVGGGSTQESPAFYTDLLTSRAILEQVVDRRFAPAARERGATLADIYEVRGATPALRREEAVKALRKHVDVALVQRSGIIRVRVASPDPAVSQQVNGALLELTNDFNLNTRRSQAKAERQFAEERLARVRDDLRASEDRLAAFFSGNRVYENSPSLSLTQTRLTRDMELQRQLNATLSQQAEQAKLDEVRDTPVLTVLERPDLPLRPEPRGTVRFTLFALVGGSVLGVLFGLLSDTMRRAAGAAPTQAAESRRRDARASGATADGGGARPRGGAD